MINRPLVIIAFLFLCVFLGILLWKVPRLDLGAVILFTLVLAGYDILLPHGERRDS